MPAGSETSTIRRLVLGAGVLLVLALAGLVVDRLFTGTLAAPFDFTEYWTAGRLNANGENPYDGTKMRDVQRSLGLDDTAIMMWNPPWTLTLVMPLGLLPFRIAYGAWVLLHVGLMLASSGLLWRGFDGPRNQRWIAYLLALAFVPTIFLIGSGQITAIVLIGLAGFLVCIRANRPLLAGAIGALTAVKPHLLGLFALWLLLEAGRDRFGRKVLLGGAFVGLLACIPPTLANPEVWSNYFQATTGSSSADHHNLARWTPPLIGWWLRTAVPGQPFWVQWLPLLFGAAGFVWWYFLHLSPTKLGERFGTRNLPAIVGLSLLLAPYGVWQHDLVLLLVPILATGVKLAKTPHALARSFGVGSLVLANAAMLAMMVDHTSSEWYVWVTPAILLGCWGSVRLANCSPSPTSVPLVAGA